MKSKLFVGTLLAAAVLTAGAAHAQAPDVFLGTLKADQVKVYNVTFDTTGIISLEAIFRQANIDADIVLVDDASARQARDADDENAFAVFNSTVKAYEQAVISRVAGSTVTVCIVHESGSNSKYTLMASSKTGTGLAQGAPRQGASVRITEAASFDINGPVHPDLAGVQEIVQKVRAQKR